MSGITTHVLDLSHGRPAVDLEVELHKKSGNDWKPIGAGLTDVNGRCNELLGELQLGVGTYRLTFHVGAYYKAHHIETFYTEVPVIFDVRDAGGHFHVPLLLSPFGFSTYRGS
jgi:5-hydroxyisourate hydrolase